MVEFRRYAVYIITNQNKTVLYVGSSNNLPARLIEHYLNQDREKTFAGRYNCHYLVYYELYPSRGDALAREYEIKAWRREKKDKLVNEHNPDWKFLNSDIMEWPPPKDAKRRLDR